MGDGEYVPELLVAGWRYGNEVGYSSILKDKEQWQAVRSLPTDRLQEV